MEYIAVGVYLLVALNHWMQLQLMDMVEELFVVTGEEFKRLPAGGREKAVQLKEAVEELGLIIPTAEDVQEGVHGSAFANFIIAVLWPLHMLYATVGAAVDLAAEMFGRKK